jgi:hypothetical protein
LKAETSLKPAHLQIDHRYEGSFVVKAKASSASVQELQTSGIHAEFRVMNVVLYQQSNSSCIGRKGFTSEGNISHVDLSNELGPTVLSFVQSSP